MYSILFHFSFIRGLCVTGAARPSLDRNSSQYVQYRIRALGPTPVETYSSIISLAMCEISNDPSKYVSGPFRPSCARAPRVHLKNQEGVSAHLRRSSAAPHAFVWQSRASSDVLRLETFRFPVSIFPGLVLPCSSSNPGPFACEICAHATPATPAYALKTQLLFPPYIYTWCDKCSTTNSRVEIS
ncbi:hypothetical protein B0H14DRAFT_28477 [Mycena olivaceomarginata]|nr:hypothetical protein B0H14DRAFT_28477 [Mycena olivaceomarginata]